MDALDQHDFTPWDWAPIGTLVALALTVFVIIRIGVWAWRYVTAPVPPVNLDDLPFIPTVIVPAGHPLPVSMPVAPPAVVVGTATVVERALVVALSYPTMEMPVVRTPVPEAVVVEHLQPATLVEDELGVWDPDAVDWLAPAEYIETIQAVARLRNWNPLPEEKRQELAASFRQQTIAAIDAVLTGS